MTLKELLGHGLVSTLSSSSLSISVQKVKKCKLETLFLVYLIYNQIKTDGEEKRIKNNFSSQIWATFKRRPLDNLLKFITINIYVLHLVNIIVFKCAL